MIGNLELAELLPDPDARAHALTQALGAAQRGAGLTRQLLDFASDESAGRAVDDVAQLVGDTARFSLRGTATRLDAALPADLWPVAVDAGQLAQVVQNLSLNAAQAVGAAGGTLSVSGENTTLSFANPHALPAGDYVLLRFCDDGPGVPPSLRDNIFEPWFTTRDEGTGLGLAVSFSILRHHGGHLSLAESAQGACFEALLPRAQASGAVATLDLPAPPPPFSVLVMDDEPLLRSIALRQLTHLGYTVTVASDGQEAVARYRQALATGDLPDVVLLDLTVVGGMGGRQALQALRALDPDVRAVATTGSTADDTRAFDAILRKPYGIEELTAALGQAARATRG